MDWTLDKLKALDAHERHDLWKNAKRLGANELVTLIEDSGLSYMDPSGLKLDSPLGRAISAIVNSPGGKAAAFDATERGEPALAGLDPMISASLEDEYEKTY